METNEPAWRRFERLAARIQRELAPDADVREDDKIVGFESGVPRQIDISIRRKVGQFDLLIVVDCKDHADKLDIKVVEEFTAMVSDVRANKGAIIASRGFTPAAITYAKHHGIDTYQLVDAESLDWNGYASIPALLITEGFAGYTFRIHHPPLFHIGQSDVTENTMVYTASGSAIGRIYDLIVTAWRDVRRDLFGDQVVTLCPSGFIDVDSKKVGPVLIEASIRNERKLYFGNWPVRIGGLNDVQSGKKITQEVVTTALDMEKLIAGELPFWHEIESEGDLATIPSLRLLVNNEPRSAEQDKALAKD